ncbi:bilobe protein [Novymonas esmeraldas]|uniref:Bilobe protein n=1 Tax=Novymonas esmeraldas TaxID=1808958 RepID=A0AAW0F7K8_9TRYP
MIQLDFVLYRFVCDISTFTGLFAEDAEGRHIPDVASFNCHWSRTPRAKPSSSESAAAAAAVHVAGATDNIHFKALGADMALTFSTQPRQLILDGDRDVITFAIRPSQYSAAGPLPIVAKGTLDPNPYFDKPKKNYAIKLRDAAGEVTGKLLFSLRVHEIDEDERAASHLHRSAVGSVAGNSPIRGGGGGQSAMQRNPSRDRLLKTPPRSSSAYAVSTPPSSERRVRGASTVVERRPEAPRPPPPPSIHTAASDCSSLSRRPTRVVHSVDILLERVAVRTESIDLDHPAPLLLGGDYNMKIRYGSYAFSTSGAVCRSPKEVEYHGQQASITLQSSDSAEKLRFSLWEDRRQVAGFSLDPAKFKSEVGDWKEYAIPFRYHPTGQRAALDVRVRRVATISGGGSPPSGRPLSPPPTASTAPQAVPRQLTYHTDPANGHGDGGIRSPPPPPPPSDGIVRASHENPIAHRRSSSSSPPRRGGGGSSPPGSIIITSRLPPPQDTHRTGTPLRVHQPFVEDNGEFVSGYRGARVCEPSGVRGGWERTPVRQRPPPLTSNLAELPAELRAPDEHERYIAEVLARLERRQRAPRPQTSLMEEWLGWRDDRERSRCNSVSSMHLRSPSVNSVASRADSMASVVSRRASAPRPTKSNADNAIMAPYTPDTTAYRRRRTSPSPAARNPLI